MLAFSMLVAYVIHSISNIKISGPNLAPPSSYGMNMALSTDGTVAYVTEPTADRLVRANRAGAAAG